MSMFDKRSAADPKDTPAAAQATRPQQPPPAAKPKPQASAVIGPGISVSGEVTGTEDLRIDGKVEGTVNLRDNVVTVSHSGEVRANITASTVNVSGRLVGDIVGIEQVVLTKSAWVRGNIIAPRVNLENGSKFKGSIDMDPVEEKGAQKPKASKQPSPAQAAAPLAAASAKAEDTPIKRAAPSPRESAART
ncbi:MAG: polymer-forming cytoskeletal protein [Gammaproteobacteria bacterium]|nr:polymer-forming cytoskeletal protein [Gammaproteobacteria bacterium]